MSAGETEQMSGEGYCHFSGELPWPEYWNEIGGALYWIQLKLQKYDRKARKNRPRHRHESRRSSATGIKDAMVLNVPGTENAPIHLQSH